MSVLAPVTPVTPVSLRGPQLGVVLDDLSNWFTRFIYLEDVDQYDLLALWVVHTWFGKAMRTTPRLLLDSPVPGSGKTTLLEHIEKLGRREPKPVRMGNGASAALLARLLKDGERLLLLDEADRSLSPKDPSTEARLGILNTGYKVGGMHIFLVPKGNDWEPTEIQTFAPVVIAGNSPQLPDDTRDRCIEIQLMPDQLGLIEDSDWEEIDEEIEALRDQVERATTLLQDEVSGSIQVSLPDNCKGRDKERWRPLKRVALLAGPDWVEKVDRLIQSDLERKQEAREAGVIARQPHLILIEHLSDFFSVNEEFAATRTLVDWLVESHPEMWGAISSYGKPLTEQRFGQILAKRFRIHSKRPDSRGPRGYFEEQFATAWVALKVRPPEIKPAEPAKPAQTCPEHDWPTVEGRCFKCAVERQGVEIA